MSTTMAGSSRERLKAVREALVQARSERAEAEREVNSAREAWENVDVADIAKSTETAEFKAAQAAVAKRGEVADRINALTETESGILELLGGSANGAGDAAHALAGGSQYAGGVIDGHGLLAASDEYARHKEAGTFGSRVHFGTIEIGKIGTREQLAEILSGRSLAAPLGPAAPGTISTPGFQGAVVPDIRGIIQPPLKRLSLLNIIPTGTTDSNIVQYVQITAIPLSAAETAELALKPQEGLTAVDQTAPVRTIAAYMKMSRQSLDDVAGLGSIINQLMPYDVRRRIELQLLVGDGEGQDLLGLYNTTGIGAPAYVAGDNYADSILRAITVIVLSDQEPDFVTLNPIDWQNLLLMKWGTEAGATGSAAWQGGYLYGSPGQVQQPTIWGLLVSSNRVVPAGSPLVGDSMASTLLVREGINVKVSDSDQDDFVRNRVTILAEARVAYPVWRPSGFAIAALPNSLGQAPGDFPDIGVSGGDQDPGPSGGTDFGTDPNRSPGGT